MTWHEDGARLMLDVSTAGDFVSVGNRTEYPFVTGGSGVPTGWTYRISGTNAQFADVNWTTSLGRFSISNASTTDAHNANFYGARRDFTVVPGHRYIIQVQARVMDNKTYAYRRLQVQINGAGTTFATSLIARSDWEQISFPMTAPTGATYFRIALDANPYWSDPSKVSFDWGVQFQGFAIIDQDATYPPPTWKEVTCDVQTYNSRYGRSRFTSRYDVATCQIGVLNNDGEWVYSPNHPWGLRPGRFVRVRANEPDFNNNYDMFYGIIDSIADSFDRNGRALAVLSCVDISSLLSNTTVATVTSESSTFRSGDRLAMLAASAGWLPQNLFTQTGVYIQQTILANGRTVRDEMGLIADSEGGFFIADRMGRLTYTDRNGASTTSRWNTVQADLMAECPPTDYFASIELPGVMGNYLSTIHDGSLTTFSFTATMKATFDDISRAETIAAKGTAWAFRKTADGNLSLTIGATTMTSTVPLPYSDGEEFWIRCDRNYISFWTRFYHAPKSVTVGDTLPTLAQMTQLGTTIVNPVTMTGNTNDLTVGADLAGTNPLAATLQRFTLHNGSDSAGNIVYDIRVSQLSAGLVGAISFVNSTAQIVRVNETGSYAIMQRDDSRAPSTALPIVDAIPTRTPSPIVHLQSFDTDWSRDRVVNDLQLANQGGSAFQTVDPVSQAKYGPRTYQRLDFLNDNSHPEYLAERTQDFMEGYTDSVMRVLSVTFRPSKADPYLWWFALSSFLNDLVRVRYTHPTEGWGYSMVSHIQSVEHRVTTRDWEVKFELDQIEAFNRWDHATTGTGWDEAIWDSGHWDGAITGLWNRDTSQWNDGVSVWR